MVLFFVAVCPVGGAVGGAVVGAVVVVVAVVDIAIGGSVFLSFRAVLLLLTVLFFGC